MIKILIGGDICPTKNNQHLFREKKVKEIFNDLLEDFHNSNLVIANLETPIIERETPINKTGKVFGTSPETISTLKKAGINYLNLANNHIYDHGEEGLKTTFKYLKLNDVEFSGAGFNLEGASNVYIKKINNITIAIFSYAEHEFSIATEKNGGANPLDLIDFIRKIQKIKNTVDFIILLYHGGKEYYPYPYPNQKKLFEFFIDMGVNVVICQHTHVCGAIQSYNDGIIFYGQGNFVFDPIPLKNKELYQGFLIELNVFDKKKFEYKLIPFFHRTMLDIKLNGIEKMKNELLDEWNKKIEYYSNNLTNTFIKNEWEKFCSDKKYLYFSLLKGHSRIERKFYSMFLPKKLKYTKNKQLLVKNIISCETHREILLTILNSEK